MDSTITAGMEAESLGDRGPLVRRWREAGVKVEGCSSGNAEAYELQRKTLWRVGHPLTTRIADKVGWEGSGKVASRL